MLPSDFFILSTPPRLALPDRTEHGGSTPTIRSCSPDHLDSRTLHEVIHPWTPALAALLDIWRWRHPATSTLCLFTWWMMCWGYAAFFSWVLPTLPILWSLYAYWRRHYPAEDPEEDVHDRDKEKEEWVIETLMEASSTTYDRIRWMSRELDWSDADRTTAHITHLFYLLPLWMLWFHLVPLYLTFLLLGSLALIMKSPWVQLAWRSTRSNRDLSPAQSMTLASPIPLKRSQDTIRSDPADGLEVVCRLVENQRYWIGLGWTTRLLLTDPYPWQDMEGNEAPPPEAYILPEGSMTGGKELSTEGMVRLHWAWSNPWSISRALTSEDTMSRERTDPEGWRYSDGLWRSWTSFPTMLSYARRRVWARRACVQSLEHVDAAEGEDGG
ncbi:Peroxin/Dysferlin domain-containing protein [Piptocephalis cylindrospora]|uniref:Peroxin/Dysferlin domain-containing protein n=1 Tax=Piptocephalis cylindrospora TaxID=1907219 RepID=A0A4P9XZW1_9FUNG|nr:Peroxin/Dysferlin domain-containing protein [Piptocephalis cylindrospora]|eukprot:RKP11934.1 Peroxin/Dysferlin domain-containing protein [Piptocephalis cylindrospora]